ncbi:hypothetical protein FRB99_001664 [Tulasnella sp. 403]|nr:hypothetical protein FRB99_001664 [Tulasnella sp. 403]
MTLTDVVGSSSNTQDYGVFANAEFDPNEYANAVLAGETYPPPTTPGKKPSGTTSSGTPRATIVSSSGEAGKEDISVALAKLTFGIDDVSQQLRGLVTAHHEALLEEASSVHQLEGSIHAVRQGLTELSSSLEKLRLKIRVPYQNLSSLVIRLQRLQLASDVLRRTSRFVLVARRLEFQMNELSKTNPSTTTSNGKSSMGAKVVVPSGSTASLDEAFGPEGDRERTVAKAALSIAELSALCGPDPSKISTEPPPPNALPSIPLRSINAVTRHIPDIDAARVNITEEMDNMLRDGLDNLNRSLLASALQTAHNLRLLPQLVQDVVDEITEYVESRIKYAFDVARIAKEAAKEAPSTAASLMYRSRVRTEPTNVTAPQWTNALWTRLEGMIEELATCCIKIYTLEKVLKLKKDSMSKIPFLDEALKVLDSKPSATFWMTTARCLEGQSRESAKNSTFLQQTLSNGYPRLLRLFHDFFSKIGVHTDTVYSQSYQSPETVLVLRAINNFETLYLSRSSNRLTEAVGAAMVGGTRSPPGMAEGVAVARTVVNELDSSRFDPLLVRAVAKNVANALDIFVTRIDAMVVRDRSATSLVGPSTTLQQSLNAQLVSALYNCWLRLSKLEGEYHDSVMNVISPAVSNLKTSYEKVTEPLLMAIRRELTAIAARLHRVDFGKPMDAAAGGGGPSTYMRDMADKLTFIRNEVLARFNVGDLGRSWIVSIVRRTIRSFVLHASLAKPLGENGKLQLTTDMTEFEFALNAFMVGDDRQQTNAMKEAIADDYLALRGFRPLLFLDNASLVLEDRTAGLPSLIVLHHILVRSPLPLPHVLHGWKVDEYVRWVDEHTEQEAFTLVDGCLSRWEATAEEDEHLEGDDFIGAVKDEWLMYSDNAADYTRHAPIGFGASSIVYQAVYHHKDDATGKHTDVPCALKVLNLDKLSPSALKLLTRETQLMSLNKHPNVLRVRGSWMMGPQLYIAMRLMNKGSVADIIKYSFIDGLEEEVVKCILYQALQGLNYLHVNGFIHRDIKAANLLVDDDGTVLLGDLGVAVSLADDEDSGQNRMMSAVREGITGSGGGPLVYGSGAVSPTTPIDKKPTRIGKRKSFVGTPSWMAPEVIAQQHYDSAADIWSLGITVLEMCAGRAPGSRERDVKRVLLGTLQNAPPTLDREGGKFKYSKTLKDLVESCLIKDPTQRPSAEKLLKHDFLKSVKKKSYLVSNLLAGIPPLSQRQERHVVNHHHGAGHAAKPKIHPLALGSPSMTSIHSHSWDWTFPIPTAGSPRSTLYSKRDGSTPPGSIRGHPTGDHHHEGISPTASVASLHHSHGPVDPPRAGMPQRPRSRGGSFEIRQPSISPTRVRAHSRVPSYVPPHLEPDVEETGEGEDDANPDINALDAALEKLGVGIDEEAPAKVDSPGGMNEADDACLATPHVHPAFTGASDPEALLLQPPELSTSLSSSSAKDTSSGPGTPSLTRQSSNTTAAQSSNGSSSNTTSQQHTMRSKSTPTSPLASPRLSSKQPPFFGVSPPTSAPAEVTKSDTFGKKDKAKSGSMKRPHTSAGAATTTKPTGLWKRMKNVVGASSSSTSAADGERPEVHRKSSFSAAGAKAFLMERTWSRN